MLFGFLLIVALWLLNYAISFWTARVTGLSWVETKVVGGWQHFMSWMGAIMSALGFTWCYMIVFLLGAYLLQFQMIKPDRNGVVHPLITTDILEGCFALGYLIIIPGILFSGLMIWVDSLMQAWRRRSLANIGIAGWNTFAQFHNTYQAVQGIPQAWNKVVDTFISNKKKNDNIGLVIGVMLVVLALLAGVITTWIIINKYAGSRRLPQSVRERLRREPAEA